MTRDVSPKATFRRIRNYLAGRHVGATRDAALMHEVVKCMFCKVAADASGRPISAAGELEPGPLLAEYSRVFDELKKKLKNLFTPGEMLLLDSTSLSHVHDELLSVDPRTATSDVVGDLYEAFVGTSIQKNEGQFFTPQAAVSWLVEAVDPRPGERVIDPACGAGGFLSYTARRLVQEGTGPSTVASSLFGIDKDEYLTRLANLHIALTTFSDTRVLCADSLAQKRPDGKLLPKEYRAGFDVVLTNPPFGSQIVAGDEELRRSFALAHKWRKVDAEKGTFEQTKLLQTQTPPQVLFVERCLSLLRPGGRLGMVVPESLITSAMYGYVVDYLRRQAEIQAVVGMPESLFKTSGKGGTHTKTALLVAHKREPAGEASRRKIYFAEAVWCGNDSRGREIEKNDLPLILSSFKQSEDLKKGAPAHGFWIDPPALKGANLSPRYHDPASAEALAALRRSHDLVSVQELCDSGLLDFRSGDEVGKLAYGTGSIPFVRTSDISNWEIKLDPKHGVSQTVYDKYRKKQDVRAGDILMVRDGTYLVGNCALVSTYDEKIVYQSHLLKIRCTDPTKLSPYLLLALLSSEPVLMQIKANRVTQDIIDSLGNRVYELVLPVPKTAAVRDRISHMVETSVYERILAREHTRFAKQAVLATSAAHLERLENEVGISLAVSEQRSAGDGGPAADQRRA